MDLYGELILEHYKHPLNKGVLKKPTYSRREANPVCGDVVTIQLLVEKNVVKDVKFEGEGCALSIASASILTDFIKGKTVKEIKSLTDEALVEMLGISVGAVRIKCVLLPLKAIKNALG
ncbi:SUF system NifU family Fe-S cluster assembly protein [Candidatus Micrarchaeota archaeon]|nr:SUF system NifU family Fe-S cluster assembly protein [Candidatus Micrarchaeota archaeon]